MADPTRTNVASGSATASSSVTASFGFTATAGRLLVLSIAAEGTVTTPSGWTLPANGSQVNVMGHYLFYKLAAGGETSVTYTVSAACASVWAVLELDSIDTASVFDLGAGQNTTADTASYSTASITPSAGRRLAIASFAGERADTNIGTFSAFSNSYAAQASALYTGLVFGGATNFSLRIGLAMLALDGGAATSTTATITGGTSQGTSALIAAFKVNTSAAPAARRRSLTGLGI